MPPRKDITCQITYGVRLTGADRMKLEQLCRATNRTASAVVRLLIRRAQPPDISPVEERLTEEGQAEESILVG